MGKDLGLKVFKVEGYGKKGKTTNAVAMILMIQKRRFRLLLYSPIAAIKKAKKEGP